MAAPERIVFFGTPQFAVPSLRALCAAGMSPVLVVSQPPRPAGRGWRVAQPAVAREAEARGLPLQQTPRVRSGDFLAAIEALQPEAAVVVAFGQIFPRRLLEIPRFGCVNLHASLLPQYRGASPIQAAIADGARRTGVTTMLMEKGLDAGPILMQDELEIGEHETTPELAPRLADLGARLTVETLGGLWRGELAPKRQAEDLATFAPRLERRDGVVNWELPAAVLYNRWRAYQPWPALTVKVGDEWVKLLRLRPQSNVSVGDPGLIVEADEELVVACAGSSALALEMVQRAGRRPVSGVEFARGARLRRGDRLA